MLLLGLFAAHPQPVGASVVRSMEQARRRLSKYEPLTDTVIDTSTLNANCRLATAQMAPDTARLPTSGKASGIAHQAAQAAPTPSRGINAFISSSFSWWLEPGDCPYTGL